MELEEVLYFGGRKMTLFNGINALCENAEPEELFETLYEIKVEIEDERSELIKDDDLSSEIKLKGVRATNAFLDAIDKMIEYLEALANEED